MNRTRTRVVYQQRSILDRQIQTRVQGPAEEKKVETRSGMTVTSGGDRIVTWYK